MTPDSNEISLVKGMNENALVKSNNYILCKDFADDGSAKAGTSSSVAPYTSNRENCDHSSHQNIESYSKHSNYHDQLNVSDVEQNQIIAKNLLYPVDSSDFEKNMLKRRKMKNLVTSSKDEQIKSIAGTMSVATEKLWDGSIQLNTSTIVSAVAFFKSGEKAQDIKWAPHVEVKGKVRLQAFEKFIQELPRSRTRALMVISLCWKAGSSSSGLEGLKEVAEGYKESERVGFATICPGIDLYVCPRSETIITILAKFGFFKGMAAVEEDPNSLIGCVIWRRSCQPSSSSSKAPDKRANDKRQLNSSEDISENSPASEKQDEHSKQAPLTKEADGTWNQHLPETKSTNADIANHIRSENKPIEVREKSSNDCSMKSNTSLHISPSPLPYNSPIAPAPVQISPLQEEKSKDCSKSPLLHAAESKTASDSKPARSESDKRNITLGETSNNSSSFTGPPMQSAASLPFGSSPVQQQTAQRLYANSQENPTTIVLKTENFMVHPKEPDTPAMRSEVTKVILPGPPPLTPDVLERIIRSRLAMARGTSEGIVKAEISSEHLSELKKLATVVAPSTLPVGQIPLHPPLPPGPPPSRLQAFKAPPSPVDADDLPEFDFNSACQALDPPASKQALSRHDGNFPSFTKQQSTDFGKNTTPVGPTTKLIEVARRQPFTSLPLESAINSERILTQLPFHKPNNLDADKCSVGPKLTSSNLGKRHWVDDDDDMPEWCPPNFERVNHTRTISSISLPSPVHNWNSEISKHRTFNLPPSSTLLRPPRSPDNHPKAFMPGIQGPNFSHHSAAPDQMRSATGFDRSIQRSPFMQNATNSFSYQTGTTNKRPSDPGSWLQRP